MDKQNRMQEDNRMVTGSSWMTFGSLASRILGAIYIIPWMAWMGDQAEANAAHALYQMGYVPYTFFLAFATAGVPSAISKQISYFNAIREYEISKKIYKHGLILMAITGFVSAMVLFFLAPTIAESSPAADQNSATLVIRSLVPALLIIPIQSVTRGLFQGHNRMREPAISQIIEQLLRILFILGSAYIIRQVLNGDVVTAVTYSTFAAFVGAIFSMVYLFIRLKQIPTALNREYDESNNEVFISTPNLLKDIIKTSIPFVIMSTGLTVFNFIDQQTFAPLMNIFYPEISDSSIQVSYGIIQGNAYKLSTIITSFGAALAITSVPLMSDLIAKKRFSEVSYQFERAIQLLMFIMIPAVIGMFVVAEPFYTFFYQYNEFGVHATRVYAVTSLFLGLFLVMGNILQSVNLRRKGIYSLAAGLVVKLISQPLFIRGIGELGILFSTMLGLMVTIFLMFKAMYDLTHYSIKFLARRTLLILILALIMGLATVLVSNILGIFIDYNSRIQALFALLIIGGAGVVVYGYLTLKTRLAEKVIGSQALSLKQKLRIK
ncbi:MAG TPA: polysaccharide biosynthesis protein [Atopostipes sp.]|nr:polysaccharide biosynthesis protein [Atopostipes sp.]